MIQDDGAASNFEDRLRALGWLLDRHDFRAIRVAADANGVMICARRGSAETGTPSELRLTAADVVRLCRAAQRRRRPAALSSPLDALVVAQTGPAQLAGVGALSEDPPYQDMLRLIGRTLDQSQAHACDIEEQGVAFMLRLTRMEGGRQVDQVQRFYKEALSMQIATANRRRGRRMRAGAA